MVGETAPCAAPGAHVAVPRASTASPRRFPAADWPAPAVADGEWVAPRCADRSADPPPAPAQAARAGRRRRPPAVVTAEKEKATHQPRCAHTPARPAGQPLPHLITRHPAAAAQRRNDRRSRGRPTVSGTRAIIGSPALPPRTPPPRWVRLENGRVAGRLWARASPTHTRLPHREAAHDYLLPGIFCCVVLLCVCVCSPFRTASRVRRSPRGGVHPRLLFLLTPGRPRIAVAPPVVRGWRVLPLHLCPPPSLTSPQPPPLPPPRRARSPTAQGAPAPGP